MSAVAAHRTSPLARRLRLALTVVVMLAGLLTATVVWLRVAHTLSRAHPVTVPTIHPVSGVVWANRVFSSQHSLEVWLRSHGTSYATWAGRHPRLAAVLETAPRPLSARSRPKG